MKEKERLSPDVVALIKEMRGNRKRYGEDLMKSFEEGWERGLGVKKW